MKTQYTKIVGQIHPPFYPTPKDEESFDKYLAKFTCLIKGFVFVIAFFNIITMEAVRAFNNEVTYYALKMVINRFSIEGLEVSLNFSIPFYFSKHFDIVKRTFYQLPSGHTSFYDSRCQLLHIIYKTLRFF